MKKRAMIASVLIVFFFLIHADSDSSKNITILFTHDLHSYFEPVKSSVNGRIVEKGGYARLCAAIKEEKNKNLSGTVVLDAGDFSMGTLFHTLFMTEGAELRLMGDMGYDALTLGNHDFDFHPDGLAKSMKAAKKKSSRLPQLVASNVIFSREGEGDALLSSEFRDFPVKDYVVFEKNGTRIGVFGLLGKDAADDAPFAKPVTFSDQTESARKTVSILRDKADIIICLSHSGTSRDKSHSEDELLAKKVSGIDVIISGHSHTALSEPINIGKTVIVSCGSYGENLGVLNILWEKNSGVRIAGYSLKKISSEIKEDPEIASSVSQYRGMIENGYLAAYGFSQHQIISESSYDMTQLSAAYKNPGETGIGNLITDSYRYAVEKSEGNKYDFVNVVIQPLGHIRGSLLKGPVTVNDLFMLLSLGLGTDGTPGYPLVSMYLKGSEIKDVLEVETTISHLKEDAHLQVSGIKFRFNPNRVMFDRVTSVEVLDKDGKYLPLDKKRTYRAVVNYYTASMLDYVTRTSHGLIKVLPKDKNGKPLASIDEMVIKTTNQGSRITEIKEWAALASFLQSFSDSNGNGISEIPEKYRKPEGRIISEPSWNPLKILSGAGAITYLMLFGSGSVAAFSVFMAFRISRRVAGKRHL